MAHTLCAYLQTIFIQCNEQALTSLSAKSINEVRVHSQHKEPKWSSLIPTKEILYSNIETTSRAWVDEALHTNLAGNFHLGVIDSSVSSLPSTALRIYFQLTTRIDCALHNTKLSGGRDGVWRLGTISISRIMSFRLTSSAPMGRVSEEPNVPHSHLVILI